MRPDTSTTGKHIPALDGVRGVAILLVLMLHLLWSNNNPDGGVLIHVAPRFISAGSFGVDLFFALSGFLITGILFDTLGSSHFFRNFYIRRSLRVFPLYFGFLLLLSVGALVRGEHWHGAFVGVLTYGIFHADGPMSDAKWINLNHFWSLAVEEQFYLCWPLAVYFLRSKHRIVAVAVTLAMLSFGYRCYVHLSGIALHDPYRAYSSVPARLDGLLLGSALAIGIRSRYREWIVSAGGPVFFTGMIVLLVYITFIGDVDSIGRPWMQTVGLFTAALVSCAGIAGCLKPKSILQHCFQVRWLRFLGRYSYGLYVMHYTIHTAIWPEARHCLSAISHSKAIGVLGSGVISFCLSLIAAMLSFHYFEQPILSLKRHFQDDSPSPKLKRQLANLVA